MRRLDRQQYIEEVKATLKRELAAAGVTAEISGRPKHIHSIWTKMRRKQAGIDELYDIRAVRILVEEGPARAVVDTPTNMSTVPATVPIIAAFTSR